MNTIIKKKKSFSNSENLIILCKKNSTISHYGLLSTELNFIQKKKKDNTEIIFINQYNRLVFIVIAKKENNQYKRIENIRLLGDKVRERIKNEKSCTIVDAQNNQKELIAFTEGMALSNYEFKKHKTNTPALKLKTIYIHADISKKEILELQNIIAAVHLTRDLVNEPFSHLTASDLAKSAKQVGKNNGLKTTVFNKKKIESLKMGGLLAVNKGSIDEPTFTIMEWKPKNAINKKPIIIIGKGIVYDTGGLSLKPTANSMDIMKVDMGGAGVVIGTMQAISSNNLNAYVIGLIPATDNRPSGNAYAPGDVITMHNKKTVEVLNTDAEGRLILADALSFAEKYNPKLVIDLATLTGAAARAIGHYGIVSMHENAMKEHNNLKKVGDVTHERLAEMPFWDDYNELIMSDIADIKNLGGAVAGAITAGKFLAHFINYPWIHLDIAGPTFVKTKYGYRGKGATGIGVRLLYHFLKKETAK